MTKLGNTGRAKFLITVGTAMAASMMATAAHAGDTTVTPLAAPPSVTASTSVNAHDIIDGVLNNQNTANISASITNATGTITSGGTGTTTTFAVDSNHMLSTAIGNKFTNSISPTVIGNDDGDGAASLGLSTDTGVVSSTVGTNTIDVNLANLGTVGISASSNSIEADATVNDGSSTISGDIPIGYASTTAGTSTISTGSPWLQSTGGLLESTVQISAPTTSSANATDNHITLSLNSLAAQTFTSAPALDDNTIAAAVKGNRSDSIIEVDSGAPATFQGTAVVDNAQLNVADLTGSNSGSHIVATIAAAGAAINTLNGGLTVDDNTTSSAATGNEALGDGVAGNRIVIGDQVMVDGGQAGVSAAASVDTVYNALTMTSTTNADLLIHNSQGNFGTSGDRVVVAASTTGSQTGANVEQVGNLAANIGGSVDVSGNQTTSTARGNTASSAFATGDNIATFAASVALANQQTNTYANTTAAVTGSSVFVNIDPTTNIEAPVRSTVDVNDNFLAASAFGNAVSQSVDLSAVQLELPSTNVVLSGGTGPDGNVHADGSELVTNLQSIYTGNVTATESTDVHIATTYDAPNNGGDHFSDLTVSGNTQEGVAAGNNGNNSLSIDNVSINTATVFGAGAGIASVQIADSGSAISASSTSTAAITISEMEASTSSLTGNLQAAVAYGGLVGNNLDVNVLNLTTGSAVDDSVNLPSTITLAGGSLDAAALTEPAVNAAFGLLNDQSTYADVSATAGTVHSFSVTLGTGGTTADLEQGSQINNDQNTLLAGAYGNDAVNEASLGVNTLTSQDSDFASDLNLTNTQTVGATSAIAARATGNQTVYTSVVDQVVASQISTSNNTVQAEAYANRAESDTPGGHGNAVIVEANNIDTAATAGTPGEASVIGNVAITDASFSLNNGQAAAGTVAASLQNSDVAPATSASVFTDVGGLTALNESASGVVSDGNLLSAAGTGNRADNLLQIDGNALGTTGALTNFQTSEAAISALVGVDGAAGANIGGVSIRVDPGNVTASKLEVNGNTTQGSVTGNSATNALAVTGNGVTEGANYTASSATANYPTDSPVAQADYSLANLQTVGAEALTSAVYGTFAIDMNNAGDITASTLKVDGNKQTAQSIANNGTNSVAVTANNLSAGSSLASFQDSSAAVSALSNVDIFAPIGMLNSSASISGNKNSALAVVNNATNSTTIKATNTDTVGAAATNADLSTNLVFAFQGTADDVLMNYQTAHTSVSGTAVTNIFNDDNTASLDSVDASSVDISGNLTSAEASANRAANTMTVTAGASLDTSSGVLNGQVNYGTATASATTSATATLAGALTPAAINNGGVTVGNNSTSALARGNYAVNALNVTAGSDYGVADGNSASGDLSTEIGVLGVGGIDARDAVLNLQANLAGADVSATSSQPTYAVALNSTTVATLNGASVAVNSNSVSATAYGNQATNLLSVAPLNTNMPTAAIGSRQVNQAGVTATVNLASFAIGSGTGSITGSSTAVTGNTITATAVGNSAVNAIGSH